MMVDPDVHFHVIPRYPGARSFMGADYCDAGWPGPPDLQSAVTAEPGARDALLDRLRGAWSRAELTM